MLRGTRPGGNLGLHDHRILPRPEGDLAVMRCAAAQRALHLRLDERARGESRAVSLAIELARLAARGEERAVTVEGDAGLGGQTLVVDAEDEMAAGGHRG